MPKKSHYICKVHESCIVVLIRCVLSLSDPLDLFMLVKLAEVTLLLEELSMVVSTIKTMFMGHII